MNGLELIRFLKAHPVYCRIPIVIVSTEGAAEDQRRGLALGADAYIVKPFRPDHLAQVVRTIWLRYEQNPPSVPSEKPAWPPER
jgi:two-component system chemotaxis response regulator CheY